MIRRYAAALSCICTVRPKSKALPISGPADGGKFPLKKRMCRKIA